MPQSIAIQLPFSRKDWTDGLVHRDAITHHIRVNFDRFHWFRQISVYTETVWVGTLYHRYTSKSLDDHTERWPPTKMYHECLLAPSMPMAVDMDLASSEVILMLPSPVTLPTYIRQWYLTVIHNGKSAFTDLHVKLFNNEKSCDKNVIKIAILATFVHIFLLRVQEDMEQWDWRKFYGEVISLMSNLSFCNSGGPISLSPRHGLPIRRYIDRLGSTTGWCPFIIR